MLKGIFAVRLLKALDCASKAHDSSWDRVTAFLGAEYDVQLREKSGCLGKGFQSAEPPPSLLCLATWRRDVWSEEPPIPNIGQTRLEASTRYI